MYTAIFYLGAEAPRTVSVIEPIQQDEFYTKTKEGWLLTAGLFPIHAEKDLNRMYEEVQVAQKILSDALNEIYNLRNKYNIRSKYM